MKYIRHSEVGFFIWPKDNDVYHKHMAAMVLRELGGKIISAGFCTLGEFASCYGKSESLGISSIPGDTEALKEQVV